MDLEKLGRKYRHNSSVVGALAGKFARTALGIANSDRVRRYNAGVAQLELPSGKTPRLLAVCFTCGKHFEFVRLALLSLKRVNSTVAEVFIFMDRGGPLSVAQQQILQADSDFPISFSVTAYPMRAWGPKVLLSQVMAYRMIAERMSETDFLMKFDSDVIFVGNAIMGSVLRSPLGAIGTCAASFHRVDRDEEDYMQGGCYFVRGAALAKIVSILIPALVFKRTRWGAIAEDQFFSELLRTVGAHIGYEDFMYTDPIFIQPSTDQRELEARLQSLPESVDVLHFEGNQDDIVDRSNMAKTYDFLFGEHRLPAGAGGRPAKIPTDRARPTPGDALA